VDVLRTQIDAVIQDEYLTTTDGNDSQKSMIPTRDNNDLSLKKKLIITDEQNLVTGELVQVLHSKQTRIDELEKRLKQVEQQESQWKVKNFIRFEKQLYFYLLRLNMNENVVVVNYYKQELFNLNKN
jgi:hypothetical protein